jgi:hypothetical protein
MALSDLQKEAYRAVLRAVAATQLDWVSTCHSPRNHSEGHTALRAFTQHSNAPTASSFCTLGSFRRDILLHARASPGDFLVSSFLCPQFSGL